MDLLLVEQLCSEIKQIPLYTKLKESEQIMVKDQTLQPLFMKYQTAQSVFNDALRLNLDTNKDKEKLLAIKREIESKTNVANYLQNYREFNHYLDEIVKTIYKDIIDETLINNPLKKWVL
jgi:cell fate (sporulation/competence/biofilm development) regulator YlbF (YheA/YmcA/DUF963 family)